MRAVYAGTDNFIGSSATVIVQALSLATGSSCIAPPLDIVAWYPGDGNANDIIAGRNGVLQNGASFAPGIVGQAFSFDGLSSVVEVQDCCAGGFGSAPFTVALWAKFNDTTNGGAFIASENNRWIFQKEYTTAVGTLVLRHHPDGEAPPRDGP
jgi:hypothetical protein